MELTQHTSVAMTNYTLADAQASNTIKNRLRDLARLLAASGKAYPHSLETHQVKHEGVVLLTELQIHGLLPATVSMAAGCHSETPAE